MSIFPKFVLYDVAHPLLLAMYTKKNCIVDPHHIHLKIHVLIAIGGSVQSLSCVRLFATPWTTACQASLNHSMPGFPVHHQLLELFKLMSIVLVMPSSHLILCHPLLLPPSIFRSIRVFSNESALHIRWPKYWSFSFSISPSTPFKIHPSGNSDLFEEKS